MFVDLPSYEATAVYSTVNKVNDLALFSCLYSLLPQLPNRWTWQSSWNLNGKEIHRARYQVWNCSLHIHLRQVINYSLPAPKVALFTYLVKICLFCELRTVQFCYRVLFANYVEHRLVIWPNNNKNDTFIVFEVPYTTLMSLFFLYLCPYIPWDLCF